jgi:hypothetical protein
MERIPVFLQTKRAGGGGAIVVVSADGRGRGKEPKKLDDKKFLYTLYGETNN